MIYCHVQKQWNRFQKQIGCFFLQAAHLLITPDNKRGDSKWGGGNTRAFYIPCLHLCVGWSRVEVNNIYISKKIRLIARDPS